MYKVFFNQKPIFLTTELVPQTDRTPVLFIKFSSPENIIKALKSKKTDCLYLYHQMEDKLWMHFLRHFPIVEAAGGLVRHQDVASFLFIGMISGTFQRVVLKKTNPFELQQFEKLKKKQASMV